MFTVLATACFSRTLRTKIKVFKTLSTGHSGRDFIASAETGKD